jgi:hypothetical protein
MMNARRFLQPAEPRHGCCSLLGQLLDKLASGSTPTPKEEPKRLVIGGVSTVCMEDLWKEEEHRSSKHRSSVRIR